MGSRIVLTPRLALASFNRERTIEGYARKHKRIIYGAQAITANIGGFARPTRDYDIASPRPKQDARQLTKILNRQAGFSEYYNQPSKFTKGVHKIYDVGSDLKKGTSDDYGLVDFSNARIPYVTRNGQRYARLSSTVADKRRAIADPQYAFRKSKDEQDISRIQAYQRLRRLQGRR